MLSIFTCPDLFHPELVEGQQDRLWAAGRQVRPEPVVLDVFTDPSDNSCFYGRPVRPEPIVLDVLLTPKPSVTHIFFTSL
jgi:hypothetical protein